MGVHDREYYREETPRGFSLGGGGRMLVTNIVLVTVGIALADLFTSNSSWLSSTFSVKLNVYEQPWNLWQLFSYGFVHAPIASTGGIWHVGMNMFMLWMFGRVIEAKLGRKEFLVFYVAAILFSGLVWLVGENAWIHSTELGHRILEAVNLGKIRPLSMLGASGGVTAVFLLFVLYYPRETVYLWGLLAVPAWLVGALIIGSDFLRAVQGSSNVAWQAHMGGAAFAGLYYLSGRRLSKFLPAGKWKLPRSSPRLKIHDPETAYEQLDEEADRVLDKLHREGEQSLTARERKVLEKYSRRMQQKRR